MKGTGICGPFLFQEIGKRMGSDRTVKDMNKPRYVNLLKDIV